LISAFVIKANTNILNYLIFSVNIP